MAVFLRTIPSIIKYWMIVVAKSVWVTTVIHYSLKSENFSKMVTPLTWFMLCPQAIFVPGYEVVQLLGKIIWSSNCTKVMCTAPTGHCYALFPHAISGGHWHQIMHDSKYLDSARFGGFEDLKRTSKPYKIWRSHFTNSNIPCHVHMWCY